MSLWAIVQLNLSAGGNPDFLKFYPKMNVLTSTTSYLSTQLTF